MTITTRLHTFLHGQLVGEDTFGNKYYTEKKHPKDRRAKRWVRYAHASFLGELLGGGLPDPSRVPAEWHGWLHYTLDAPPGARNIPHYKWEKTHTPNLTGTHASYLPPGHLLRGGERDATTVDYDAWKPK